MATIYSGTSSSASSSSTGTATLISQGKTASASSFEGTGYEADKAFDNNGSTRWASALTAKQRYLVGGISVVITTFPVWKLSWEAAYATAYTIQVSSDNVNWTSVYTKTNGAGGIENLSVTGQGRYVRVNMTSKINPSWGYSLWDVSVYGSPTNASSSSVSSQQSSVSSSTSSTGTGFVSRHGRLKTVNAAWWINTV